jgi:hypothetical protein
MPTCPDIPVAFRSRLSADAAYLDGLTLGKPFTDPRLTGPGWLRDTHEEQLRYFGRPGS